MGIQKKAESDLTLTSRARQVHARLAWLFDTDRKAPCPR